MPTTSAVDAEAAERLVAEVDACNGCGGCRTLAAGQRMCPRYREDPGEESSPRAKANLVAAALAGRLESLRDAPGPRVLTPHPGEAARLLGVTSRQIQDDRYGAAGELAKRSGQVVVLKEIGRAHV